MTKKKNKKQAASYLATDLTWLGISAAITIILLFAAASYEQRTQTIGSLFQAPEPEGSLETIHPAEIEQPPTEQ